MNTILSILSVIIFCLVFPWIICWAQRDTSIVTKYLDWVYNIVNRKK